MPKKTGVIKYGPQGEQLKALTLQASLLMTAAAQFTPDPEHPTSTFGGAMRHSPDTVKFLFNFRKGSKGAQLHEALDEAYQSLFNLVGALKNVGALEKGWDHHGSAAPEEKVPIAAPPPTLTLVPWEEAATPLLSPLPAAPSSALGQASAPVPSTRPPEQQRQQTRPATTSTSPFLEVLKSSLVDSKLLAIYRDLFWICGAFAKVAPQLIIQGGLLMGLIALGTILSDPVFAIKCLLMGLKAAPQYLAAFLKEMGSELKTEILKGMSTHCAYDYATAAEQTSFTTAAPVRPQPQAAASVSHPPVPTQSLPDAITIALAMLGLYGMSGLSQHHGAAAGH